MRNFLICLALLGCSSTQLPAEKCTPAHQAAYLSNCNLALETVCEEHGECLPPDVCTDLVKDLCPAPEAK